MKTLESYILEAGFDKDLLYDVIISVVNNNRTIYEKCKSIAASIAKKAKKDERPNFNHLVESPVVDKLATETFKIYVSEYASQGMRLGTPERKELKKWLAAHIFHILVQVLDNGTMSTLACALIDSEHDSQSAGGNVVEFFTINDNVAVIAFQKRCNSTFCFTT